MDINIEPLKDFTSANINDIYAETNIIHNHEYVVCYNSNDTFIIIIIIIIIIIFFFFLYQTLFYLKVGEKKNHLNITFYSPLHETVTLCANF